VSTVRLYFNERVGPKFVKAITKNKNIRLAAVRGAAQDVASEIESEGRDNISNAGNFGQRWTQGLHVKVTEGGGNIRIAVSHDLANVGFWVHQNGAIIRGKPLLWIPLSFADDAQGLRARDFPGGLFRVDRKKGGAPLLLSVADGQPKYSGHESVTIPKRFRIIEIAKEQMRKMKDFYNQRVRNG